MGSLVASVLVPIIIIAWTIATGQWLVGGVGALLCMICVRVGTVIEKIARSWREEKMEEAANTGYGSVLSSLPQFANEFPRMFGAPLLDTRDEEATKIAWALQCWWNSCVAPLISDTLKGGASARRVVHVLNAFLNQTKILITRTASLKTPAIISHYNKTAAIVSKAVNQVPRELSGLNWDDNKEIK